MVLRGVALVVLSFLACVAPASAATVSYDQATETVTFTAAPGEANDVTVTTRLPREIIIADTGASLSAGAGCVNNPVVSCFATYGAKVTLVIDTGDQADRISVNGNALIGCVDPQISAGAGDDTVQSGLFQNCPAVVQLIDGGPGNDAIEGTSRVDDDLRGGDGVDTVEYVRNGLGVLIDLESEEPVSGVDDERDKLTGFENARAGIGADRLIGGPGANQLEGGGGDDVIDGGGGADTIRGGDGEDVVDYSGRTEPIAARLGGGASGGSSDGTGDALSEIEDAWGGSADDLLIGDGGDNVLNGGYGADALIGGAGEDYADYSERSEAVTVALDAMGTAGSSRDGATGARDRLSEIESVFGGDGNDVLTGNDAANYFDAGAGTDTVKVRGGGVDEVDCGDGNADKVEADREDKLSFCESVAYGDTPLPIRINPPVNVIPRPTAPTPPTAPPTLALLFAPSAQPKLGTALAKGWTLRPTCVVTCTLKGALKVDATTARRLGLTRAKKAVTIATGTAAQSGRLTLRFTSAAKRALKKTRQLKATLNVTATGSDGKKVVASRPVTLKR